MQKGLKFDNITIIIVVVVIIIIMKITLIYFETIKYYKTKILLD